ncbi:MAG TPA: hypothetical protein DCY03_23720 [Planctomycetaceae bacterium]|nr:hypothetical protein [Planctomycetaceae bacterium]
MALVSLNLQHDYETDQIHLKRNSSQSGVARLLELPIYEKLRRADALPSSESIYPESIFTLRINWRGSRSRSILQRHLRHCNKQSAEQQT